MDASGPSDATTDVPATGMDATDGSAPGDARPPGDTGADVPRDAGADVPTDAAPPCGHAGEACCGSTYCAPGTTCTGGTCAAYAVAADECSRPADCASGQACSGPQSCTTHSCFRCASASGAGTFGQSCSTAADCATGVCLRQRCATACAIGTTGDADCTSASAGAVCTQVNYTFTLDDGGMGPVTVLGICRRGCARMADCTGTESCLALSNVPADRVDWVCGVSAGTLPAGSACTGANQCQSLLCVSNAAGTSFACAAPCTSATDCPAAAARCVPLNLSRPSGALQSTMVCVP
jgi:hypothetical protein